MLGYLDAGSGSMIAGAVAAGAAGMSVAVRAGLAKFRRSPKSAPPCPEPSPTPAPATESS